MLLDDSSIKREISLRDDTPVAVEAGWIYSPHRPGGLSSPRGDVGGARDANVFFKREGRGPRHQLQFGAPEQAHGGAEAGDGGEVERMIKAGGPQAAVESVERALREAGMDTSLCARRGGRIRDMRLRCKELRMAVREGTQRESDLEVERGAASLEAARLRTANDALRRRISSVGDEGTLSFEADELRVELEQARVGLGRYADENNALLAEVAKLRGGRGVSDAQRHQEEARGFSLALAKQRVELERAQDEASRWRSEAMSLQTRVACAEERVHACEGLLHSKGTELSGANEKIRELSSRGLGENVGIGAGVATWTDQAANTERLNNMRYNLEASSRTILQLKSEAQLKDARIASLLAELRGKDAALASLQSQLRVANSSVNNRPHPPPAAGDDHDHGHDGVGSNTSPVPVICQAVYSPRKASQQPEVTSSSSSVSLLTKRDSSSNSGGLQPATAESGGNFQGWRKSAGSGRWQASTLHVVSLSPPARSPIHGPMTGTPSKFDQPPSQPVFSPKLSPAAVGAGMEGIGLSSPVVQPQLPGLTWGALPPERIHPSPRHPALPADASSSDPTPGDELLRASLPLTPKSPHIIALWERRSLEAMRNADFEAMTLTRGQTASLSPRKHPASPRKQPIQATIRSPIANQGSGLKPRVGSRGGVEAETGVWEGKGLSDRERGWTDGEGWRQWGGRGDVGGSEGDASLIEGGEDDDDDDDDDYEDGKVKMREIEKTEGESLGEGRKVAEQESFSSGSGMSSSSSSSCSSSNDDSGGVMR